jgi:hypothetical protein
MINRRHKRLLPRRRGWLLFYFVSIIILLSLKLEPIEASENRLSIDNLNSAGAISSATAQNGLGSDELTLGSSTVTDENGMIDYIVNIFV